MRTPIAIAIAAAMTAVVGALGPTAAEEAPKPRPYKPVPVELPQPVKDPTFVAFRKQIVDIAKRKDLAGLAKHVARSFFWLAGDKNAADPARSGIQNLARALDLDSTDSEGWEILGNFASDPTADPDPQRKGVICAPADPIYDANAAEEVGKLTGTMSLSWYFPLKPGLEVRNGPTTTSPVVGKLGMHLIWVYPDESPAAAVQTDIVRIVMPSGEFGFIAVDSIAPLPTDLLCYAKEGKIWLIVGLVGGEAPSK